MQLEDNAIQGYDLRYPDSTLFFQHASTCLSGSKNISFSLVGKVQDGGARSIGSFAPSPQPSPTEERGDMFFSVS
jgi:hypothetical protein